jgi:hypothetical protein
MTSNTPAQTGFAHRIASIWADIAYAQLRVVELNRPGRMYR